MKSSPRFTTNLTLLVLVLLFAAAPAVLAQDPADVSSQELYDSFKANAEKTWKNRMKQLDCCSFTATSLYQLKAHKIGSNDSSDYNPDDYSFVHGEIACDFPRLIGHTVGNEGKADEFHTDWGYKENYTFILNKKTLSDEWSIERLEPVVKRAKHNDLWKFMTSKAFLPRGNPESFFEMYASAVLGEFLLPQGVPIMSLMTSPMCVVDKYEKIENGNLRIHFTIDDSVVKDLSEPLPFSFRSGRIDLTPNDWRVVTVSVFSPDGTYEESIQNEYKADGETPFLSSSKHKSIGATIYSEDSFTCEQSQETTDPTRYTLSYYGLPEPEFVSETNRIRLVLIALGALMIGFAVWRFSRRRSAEQ